jgi:hypothetical protein
VRRARRSAPPWRRRPGEVGSMMLPRAANQLLLPVNPLFVALTRAGAG